jgi:hypothetical protein
LIWTVHTKGPNVSKATPNQPTRQLDELLAQKSAVPSKAQALTRMGLPETAQLLWAAAVSHEGRIAALLDAHGDDLEAAVYGISAASCYQKAGEPSRAANLYRAALAGPLREATRREVEGFLTECLAQLISSAPARAGKASEANRSQAR